MKEKTKRKIRRFYKTPLSILGTVFTLGGTIVTVLAISLGWIWLIVVLSAISVFIGGVLFYLWKASAPKLAYFERVNFGAPDENTIREAVDGILNTQKAEPFYVHVAPKFNEVSTIRSTLKETGFATISGKPGDGKSMVAYQATYSLQKQEGFSIYSLDTSRLEDKRWSEVSEQIFYELDESLKGKKKVILVDDAHKLQCKRDLDRALRGEAKENNGKYIWVKTEEKYEESQPKDYIRINFQDFKNRLLEGFYETKDPRFQEALAGRIEGLEDAMVRAEINDVWHFNFCATRGWEKLVQKVEDFEEDELVKLLVLFFISAHTVLRLESDLSKRYVIGTIRGLGFNWLAEQKLSISKAIDNLWVKDKLIRIYEKNKGDTYIRTLHHNFAREAIKASLLRESYVEDLLTLAKSLLTDKHHLCIGYAVFREDIGQYASQFDRDNKDWLASFISNPLTERLGSYPILLDSIRRADSDIYNEIINKLDISELAAKVSTIRNERFQALAHLLNALGHRHDDLITNENFDFGNLAKPASDAEVRQFEQLAHLLNALGKRRDELVSKLDLEKLANAANVAEVGEFKQVAELLDSLGSRKSQLSTLLDHDTFVQQADEAGPYDITGLTMFIAELEEEDRSKFIQGVDWCSTCLKCPIYVHLLSPLGASLENLWKQAELSFDKTGVEKISQHLQTHVGEIKQQIEEASTNPKLYSGVAKFLWNCNQICPTLAKKIATETMSKLADNFRVRPSEFQGTGRLINSFYAIDPGLSASFVKNNRVRGKIQRSINEHDWSENEEGLKHLIQAFYRSAPELWKKMVNSGWIVVDLSSLYLDSIYKDVDEEKNAGSSV